MTCKYCTLKHKSTDADHIDEYNSRLDIYESESTISVLNARGAVGVITRADINMFPLNAYIELYTQEDVEDNCNPSFVIPIRFCPYCGDALAPGDRE